MGIYFSDPVDNALSAIYYTYDCEKAAACIQPLTEASNAGDGDASYILSRCVSGPQYSWDYHPFQADDDMAGQLVRRSIAQGSAMGVLGAMRCGELTPEMEREALRHFSSLQEAWNAVYEKAQAGCLFCQNMIGNTYFWLDIPRIEDKGPDDFPNKTAFAAWLRETELKCLPWFERAFSGGMGFSGRNLYNLLNDGDADFGIEAQPEKALAVARLGAEKGYPDWQERYAGILKERDGWTPEVFTLYDAAANQGQLSSWFYVGYAYELGKTVGRNCSKAMECYELGLQDPNQIGCANRAGRLLFHGADGVPRNYARAIQLFEQARANGDNTWGNDMLGNCYLFGLGCEKDPARALRLFQEVDYGSDLLNYGLGTIYTDGLGVPQDIKKGVEYLQKAKNYAPAQEALLHFKKTLFGKWVRR